MRLLFVNHCHPDTPHVCATRLREFAAACAEAGHQVLLLTESLPDGASSHAPGALADALARHDWSRPFHLACAPIPGRLVAALREGRVPRLLRRPLLAAAYATRSGLFTDWRDGSRPYWPVLAKHFRPERCWATFGNTDALVIARGVARLAGCPWLMDVKDPWSVFIPPPLRRLLAGRFHDAAGFTALSDQHGADVRRWFGRAATTIYSGIDENFLPPPPPCSGVTRLLVIGGLYDDAHLAALLGGIARWRRSPPTVTYAGGEAARFRAAAARHGIAVETPGWLDLAELCALAADSAALLYVRNPAALYQHKLVELLALDRPVLCLPEEAPESLAIATKLGAAFRSCADAGALARGLAELVGRPVVIDRKAVGEYTWAAQARRLLAVLEGAA